MRTSYAFRDCRYLTAAAQLRRNGEVLPVQPKVLDALELFLERPGELVAREALTERLWPDVFVSDNSLEQVIRKLRRAVGDERRPFQVIETVPGRGYRFVAEVLRQEDASPVHERLPRPPDDFRGRDDELAALGRRLEEGPLVTVLGPGGSGKTALALQWGRGAAARFVDLTAARDLRGVVAALGEIADTPGPGTLRACVASVPPEARLVLDNAEHVLGDVATVVRALLDARPDVAMVVTSRVRLGLAAERCVELGPLARADGVALLRARADALREALGDQIPDAVAGGLHDVLEGMPLAIRLAAPRLRLMSAEALLQRLSERIGWLRSHDPTAPARQRSLQASMQWSWELLPPEVQRAAAECTVFRGGFTLAAAEAVLSTGDDGAVVEHLMVLRDASMLVSDDRGPEPRFDLPQPLREIAAAHLVEQGLAEATVARHVTWAAGWFGQLRASGAPAVRAAAKADLENLWAAAQASREPRELVHCARSIAGVSRLTSDPHALRALFDRVIDLAGELAPDELFGALNDRALLRGLQLGDVDGAQDDLAWLDRLAGELTELDTDAVFEVAMTRGRVDFYAGRLDDALGHFRHALDRSALTERFHRPRSQPRAEAHARLMIGEVHRFRGEIDAALEQTERSLAAIAQVDFPWLLAIVLTQLGVNYRLAGRLADQRAVQERALAVFEQNADAHGAARTRRELARNALFTGEPERAAALLAEAEGVSREPADQSWIELNRAWLALRRIEAGGSALDDAEAALMGTGAGPLAVRAEAAAIHALLAARRDPTRRADAETVLDEALRVSGDRVAHAELRRLLARWTA